MTTLSTTMLKITNPNTRIGAFVAGVIGNAIFVHMDKLAPSLKPL